MDVLSALRTFPDDNDVLRFACGALAGLASDASCSRAMGEAGACELVMDVLARSLEDVNVTETACWSVYNLSLVDPANRTKLVLLGVRNVLVQVSTLLGCWRPTCRGTLPPWQAVQLADRPRHRGGICVLAGEQAVGGP